MTQPNDPNSPLPYAGAEYVAGIPIRPIIQTTADALTLIAPPPPMWRLLIGPALALAIETFFALCALILLFTFIRYAAGMGMGALPLLLLVIVFLGLLMYTSIRMLRRRSWYGRRPVRIEMTRQVLRIDDPAHDHDDATYPLRNLRSIAVYPSALLLSSDRVIVLDFDVRSAFATVRILAPDSRAGQEVEAALRGWLKRVRAEDQDPAT
jgi:hypothetical protein